MPDYRIITVNADGKTSNSRRFVCNGDKNAVVWAEQQLDQQTIELWSGARIVARLRPKEADRAVSHGVHEGRLVPKNAGN